MPQQPETKIVNAIRGALTVRGCLVWKIHGGPFQAAGIPDIVGLTATGRFVGIEVKQPGKKATPLQELWLRRIREHNGIAGVATSVAEAIDILESQS